MSITVAKTAGFCFGVSRAVQLVEELLAEGKSVYTLGPIIHNPQMVQELSDRGVRIAQRPEDVSEGATLVIRSHGVPRAVTDRIEALGLDCRNATCPFVLKIHKIVAEHSALGEVILIAGDEQHPEVQGIIGHCEGEVYTFSGSEDVLRLFQEHPELPQKPVCVVAQTTFDIKEWKNCLKHLQNLCSNGKIFNTICSATSDRQSEAAQLASRSDFMLVIGGRHSSNTNKLYSICSQRCQETYLIETAQELPTEALKKAKRIGITAGASTPASIIKEVLATMSEEIRNPEEGKAENFEDLLEESLKNLNTSGRVHGVVVNVTPTEVQLEVVGRKQTGIIPLDQLSADPNAKPEELVKVGDEFDAIIMKTNDQEGTLLLSKKLLDAQKGWDEIVEAFEQGTVLHGVVSDVVKGGVLVVTKGMRVFIPASQATASRNDPLDDLLKKEVDFKIIEVTSKMNRKRAVGSIREVLRAERKKKEAAFWETAEVGKVYTGVVKSIAPYGAFVDIGGIDGMVHKTELSWTKIKSPADVVSEGDTIEVYIKALDQEKGKISLGYKKEEDNPWNRLQNEYPEGTICQAVITNLTPFGAFARLDIGVEGLIHVSQISNERVEKPDDVLKVGQTVTVKVIGIDFEKKRISLSMKQAVVEEPEEE